MFIGRRAAVIPGHACVYGPSLLWHIVQGLLLGLVILSSFHPIFCGEHFSLFSGRSQVMNLGWTGFSHNLFNISVPT